MAKRKEPLGDPLGDRTRAPVGDVRIAFAEPAAGHHPADQPAGLARELDPAQAAVRQPEDVPAHLVRRIHTHQHGQPTPDAWTRQSLSGIAVPRHARPRAGAVHARSQIAGMDRAGSSA